MMLANRITTQTYIKNSALRGERNCEPKNNMTKELNASRGMYFFSTENMSDLQVNMCR
jgi:hypothetical protein